uniref:Cytoskeleton-associated protein 5 n=1 Tax=Rhizophora mucronata TaxID=61149 RepID=A0A2P2MMX7_RHIMU
MYFHGNHITERNEKYRKTLYKEWQTSKNFYFWQ